MTPTSMTSREKLSSDCAESDSNIIKYLFKGCKLSEIARNVYSYIIKGLLHWNRWILSLVGISTDARKLASFDIPTRDNIHRYQCNNPIKSTLFLYVTFHNNGVNWRHKKVTFVDVICALHRVALNQNRNTVFILVSWDVLYFHRPNKRHIYATPLPSSYFVWLYYN